MMNSPNTKLSDLIHVVNGIIPSNICEDVIEEIERREWSPHQWYNPNSDSSFSKPKKELDVQHITLELQEILTPFVIESGREYNNKYAYQHPSCYINTRSIMDNFCQIRFNRYSGDQIMHQHIDHIYSLFDGTNKGIPVLSFILNFNDDYEGADLFFWEDTVVKLGKGDIVMFPSCFLFPHGVTEAIKGIRYSGVCWGW